MPFAPDRCTPAASVDRDRDAVIAGLTLPWSSRVVEGHVNRIKLPKRHHPGGFVHENRFWSNFRMLLVIFTR